MTSNHPITPPPELVNQWCHEDGNEIKTSPRWHEIVCTKAARWGADQELEACCKWLDPQIVPLIGKDLRGARRSKPPSLKEQALQELELLRGDANAHGLGFDALAIRRALEALPD